jgi:hypothetical protein
MPHQFQSINCKKCNHHYCPVCKDKCPNCGEIDVADEKTMLIRKQMKAHMHKGNSKINH